MANYVYFHYQEYSLFLSDSGSEMCRLSPHDENVPLSDVIDPTHAAGLSLGSGRVHMSCQTLLCGNSFIMEQFAEHSESVPTALKQKIQESCSHCYICMCFPIYISYIYHVRAACAID